MSGVELAMLILLVVVVAAAVSKWSYEERITEAKRNLGYQPDKASEEPASPPRHP